MGSLRSYYDYATCDYLYATSGYEMAKANDMYRSGFLGSVEQAVEKYLKHVLDSELSIHNKDNRDLLHTHNLRYLYKRACDFLNLTITEDDAAWLRDFYYTARYPGDVPFTATADDVERAAEILDNVRYDVDKYILSRTIKSTNNTGDYAKMMDLFKKD